MLRAGFGEEKRAIGKVEGRETAAAGELRSARAPVKAAGDHEVEDEPKVSIEADGDALPDAAQFANTAFGAGNRRLYGAEEKRASEADALQRLARDALVKGEEVSGDVGEFGHEFKVRVFCLSFEE